MEVTTVGYSKWHLRECCRVSVVNVAQCTQNFWSWSQTLLLASFCVLLLVNFGAYPISYSPLICYLLWKLSKRSSKLRFVLCGEYVRSSLAMVASAYHTVVPLCFIHARHCAASIIDYRLSIIDHISWRTRFSIPFCSGFEAWTRKFDLWPPLNVTAAWPLHTWKCCHIKIGLYMSTTVWKTHFSQCQNRASLAKLRWSGGRDCGALKLALIVDPYLIWRQLALTSRRFHHKINTWNEVFKLVCEKFVTHRICE